MNLLQILAGMFVAFMFGLVYAGYFDGASKPPQPKPPQPMNLQCPVCGYWMTGCRFTPRPQNSTESPAKQ